MKGLIERKKISEMRTVGEAAKNHHLLLFKAPTKTGKYFFKLNSPGDVDEAISNDIDILGRYFKDSLSINIKINLTMIGEGL